MSDETVTIQGDTLHLEAKPLGEGDTVPEFRLVSEPGAPVAFDTDERSESVHIITTALSVDTPVCANQFRAFDERAEDLSDEGIEVWYVTRDLPFALERFAGEHDLEHVQFLSDYQFDEFGDRTGLAIEETGLLTRATFVVDRDGKIVYAEVLDEIAEEPDYAAAVEAAREVA